MNEFLYFLKLLTVSNIFPIADPLPAWGLMWLMAFGLYIGCKVLTLRSVNHPFTRKGAGVYLLGWPGMNAPEFFHQHPVHPPAWTGISSGLSFLLAGVGLMMTAGTISSPLLQGLLGMVSVVFGLHFGVFRLLAEVWSARGWQTPALMRTPMAARSLADFWGHRWNRAFRDITHRFFFRPLARRFGPAPSLLIGFLASGLVHELVITVPAKSGTGGPTLYFLLQGTGLLLERGPALAGHPLRRRIFLYAVLLIPLPLLFPPAFMIQVMSPFVQTLTL